ncbi:baseplate J/gp47 family protein [Methylomonas sp. MgM2]
MAISIDCKQNTDPLKLPSEGTRQDDRFPAELDPAYAPVDGRRLEHALVFAEAYSRYLKFYGLDNQAGGDWSAFFSRDVSAQLAVAAVQDIAYYKSRLKSWFDFLNDRNNDDPAQTGALKIRLGWLFSAIGTLAQQLEQLKQDLPDGIGLKQTLRNLIRGQLAGDLTRLAAYHLAFPDTDADFADAHPDLNILGKQAGVFGSVYHYPFSEDWITSNAADWPAHAAAIVPDASVYGSGAGLFERVNHIATHSLFTGIFDQFLKVYARSVTEAGTALQQTLTERDDHEPHYALLLAFLRLFDYVRAETNTLTGRHLDFYYRQILRLKERPAQPGHVHLLVELARQAESFEIAAGELFKAGKDAGKVDAFFANDATLVANQSQVAALKNWYRHKNTPNDSLPFADGRLFAAAAADSDDGLGAKLTSSDQSWQPFFNKAYQLGTLAGIDMPVAELGFAIASHYLFLAEGVRTVALSLTVDNADVLSGDRKDDLVCLFTGAEGWLSATTVEFKKSGAGILSLVVKLDGSAPAVTAYSDKVHGYHFATGLPVLLVKLAHRPDADFIYGMLENVKLTQIGMSVEVSGLKTLALSNDFGPVDASKPFQPFGAIPAANSSLVIGSREAFQKQLTNCKVGIELQNTPSPYPAGTQVKMGVDYLKEGQWQAGNLQFDISAGLIDLPGNTIKPFVDAADFSNQELYTSASRHGYIRLKLNKSFGQDQYEQALVTYIANTINKVTPNNKPTPPVAPSFGKLTLSYVASQTLALTSAQKSDFDQRGGRFFHLTPFGNAEQHGYLKNMAALKSAYFDAGLYLLPQFKHLNRDDKSRPDKFSLAHEAESYIGVSGLKPAQNLALLFQVTDGTANPLSKKPKPHLHWSYLSENEWLPFDEYAVQDGTGEWLNSGIITLAIPAAATSDNTLLPSGQFWLRAAVAGLSDAVCRLRMVAAQGLRATFEDHGNDPAFPATPLAANTISKLNVPNAAVKSISQPFPGFGGQGAEQPAAFYTRVSERLRHKNRAIALWDYEHLLLQAFPQIYQTKCLNHTHYEPGSGIYRELAPGHVTVVTIPSRQADNLRDPLRPFTSLGVLTDVKAFLQRHLSCFVKLHVENPLFEEVRASFKVHFYDGFDSNYYQNQLGQAITRFLSPWAFPGGGYPSFGGKVYKSILIDFVEEQPYVDYVTDFKLSHSYETLNENGIVTAVTNPDQTEIAGSKAVSLLVSARQHGIEVINPTQTSASGSTCRCESS